MNDIDIFLLLYLIFAFLISFLISFLFLKKYQNSKSKIPDKKYLKYSHIYYYSIIHFAFIIFYILITILDHATFTFKDISNLKGTLFIFIKEFLQYFYEYFSYYTLFTNFIMIPILTKVSTTGFYDFCNIFWDVINRYIDDYFNYTSLGLGCLALAIFIAVMIPFHEWILKATNITSLWSLFTFIKFLLNYLNFKSYLKILFYIGFAIQNIVRMDSIKRNKIEKENFYLWKLGAVFIYYIKEITAIEFGFDEAKQKYEKYKSKHNDAKFDLYWEINKKNIQDILSSKLLEADLDGVQEAYERYGDQFREDENNKVNKKEIEKEFKGMKDKIKEIKKNYTKKMLSKTIFNCCYKICCCCKRRSEASKIKEEICEILTKVNIEVAKTFRKGYIIDKLDDNLKYSKYEEINCCRKLKCVKFLWLIFLIILIILEFPYHMIIEEDKLTLSYSFINFLIILLIYSVSVIFYFSIFIYSAINYQYIQGNLIFGKLSELINFVNFIGFVYSFYTASIYHSLWVFNKNGNIKALFYKIYFLPENIINFTINDKNYSISTLDIICYGTLIFILISIFMASKYTKFNENTEFFFSEYEFYFYFILGCACNIYLRNNLKKQINNKNEEIIPNDDLNESLV